MSQSLWILILKCLCFLGPDCLKITHSLNFRVTSSTTKHSGQLQNLANTSLKMSDSVPTFHSLSQFLSLMSSSLFLSEKLNKQIILKYQSCITLLLWKSCVDLLQVQSSTPSDCFVQCPVCTVTPKNRSMSFVVMSHRGCNYSEICQHIEGNAVFVERRDLIFWHPWEVKQIGGQTYASLCRASLPVPTITGPRFCTFFSYPHFNVTQLTAAYIRTSGYGKLSFSLNTAMFLLCIQDEQNLVHITDTLSVL